MKTNVIRLFHRIGFLIVVSKKRVQHDFFIEDHECHMALFELALLEVHTMLNGIFKSRGFYIFVLIFAFYPS